MAQAFTYWLVNQTPSKVTIGLWSAPDKHQEVHTIDGNSGPDKHEAKYADARIVGVWLDSGNLYPNNENPYVKGGYFQDGGEYTITVTTNALVISPTPPSEG